MKTKKFQVLGLMVFLLGVVVACSPAGSGTEISANPTGEAATTGAPAETPEVAIETPEVSEGEEAMQEVTYFVGPELVDCTGVAPQKCLLVKEDPNADYQLFYSPIEGFEFIEGFEYELRVQVEPVENAPADASALRYTLLEVISQTRALEGNVWALESWLNDAGEMVPAIEDSGASAEFRGGQVSGNGGCNSFSGGFERNGNELTVGQLASTLMLCTPEELGTQETAFLAHLQSAATFQISDDRLDISNRRGEVVLTFTILEPASLTGTNWMLTSYNNGQGGVVTLVPETQITAVFGEDGRLNGVAGCNNYMTSFTAEGNNITIQPAASTRKLCPGEGVMEQETAYLMALENATTYTIRGNQLELRGADGELIASFEQG
jgi:heat shock protein HslJ